MRKRFLQLTVALFAMGFTGLLACSNPSSEGGGGGGMCGGAPPEKKEKLNCSPGTHEENGTCKRNAKSRQAPQARPQGE